MNWREKLRLPLMLAPALAVIIVLYTGGLAMGLMQSLGYMPVIGEYEFTLRAYTNVLTDPRFLDAAVLTLRLSIATTILSSLMAIFCALTLRQNLWGKKLVTFVFQLNVPMTHIVGAIAVILLLSQSGFVSRLAYLVGLIQEPADFPVLVFDKHGIGIILEYLWKTTAFTGVILLAVLQSIGEDYEDMARTLGASRWQRCWYVILPLIMPGLLRAAILVFSFAFGTFEIPFLLGQTYPMALPVLALKFYHNVDLGFRREAMATSMIMAAMITILVLLYMKLAAYVRAD